MRGSTQTSEEIYVPQFAIPKPKGLVSRLPAAMGLDDAIVHNFTFELRTLAEKYLNTRQSWKSQNEARRDRCINKACKRFPFLLRYQNAWPIEKYLESWLANRAWRSKRRASQDREHERDDAHLKCSETPSRRAKSARQRTHPYETRGNTQRDSVEMKNLDIITVDSEGDEPSSRRSVHNTRSVVQERAHLQRTAEPSESVVRKFLRSACPILEVTAPRFFEAGVHNEAWLRALASLPEADLHKFLERKVGLNRLQSALVEVALQKYIL